MIQDVHDALCFSLWHHQGGSSTIGQPIRKMLDLGPHDHMDKDEIAGAKRVQSALEARRKPLTDEEILAANYPDGEENGPTIAAPDFDLICFARQIEAAHGIKEKNNG